MNIAVMTPEQIDLIRRSFDRIWPVRRKLAGLFYSRFFELAPDAHRLFPADLERQHLKLMDMIAAIVGALDQRELFQSLIGHSGRQHAQFGVKPLHFVAFGDALIWSLEHRPLAQDRTSDSGALSRANQRARRAGDLQLGELRANKVCKPTANRHHYAYATQRKIERITIS